MVLEFARGDAKKAEIFKYIYLRNRAQNPTKSDKKIQAEMMEKFNISKKTLEKYIYLK